jgi:hypothetical protein
VYELTIKGDKYYESIPGKFESKMAAGRSKGIPSSKVPGWNRLVRRTYLLERVRKTGSPILENYSGKRSTTKSLAESKEIESLLREGLIRETRETFPSGGLYIDRGLG